MSENDAAKAEDLLEDDIDGAERGAQYGVASPPNGGRRRFPLIIGGTILVAAIVVTALVLASGGSKSKPPPPATPGFTTFRDTKDGLSLTYPSDWVVSPTTDPNVPLLLTFGTPGIDFLVLRVNAMQQSVDTKSVANMKAVTDGIISGTAVSVVAQRTITTNGLIGYFYLYTLPPDKAGGVTLAHSHFFFFPPRQLVSLVFQTSNDEFQAFAPTFDKVIASLHYTPATTSAP